MAWVDVPISHIKFGLFEPSPATSTVTVAPADLLLFRYKLLSPDTVVVDFRIGKAFFHTATAGASGITMELKVPFSSVYFPAIGSPSSFMDGGQTYTNDCVIAIDGQHSACARLRGCLERQEKGHSAGQERPSDVSTPATSVSSASSARLRSRSRARRRDRGDDW